MILSIMRFDLREIRCPRAEGGLTSTSFSPSDYQSYLFLKKGMELILIPAVGGRTSPHSILRGRVSPPAIACQGSIADNTDIIITRDKQHRWVLGLWRAGNNKNIV